jgi:hypothetical protein
MSRRTSFLVCWSDTVNSFVEIFTGFHPSLLNTVFFVRSAKFIYRILKIAALSGKYAFCDVWNAKSYVYSFGGPNPETDAELIAELGGAAVTR